MKLGKRIKELRKSKNLTLVELSKASGVQIATLSRIENDKMVGSLESHMNIAKALGVDITDMLAAADEKKSFVDLQNGEPKTDVYLGSNKASFEILTSNILQKAMMPSLIKIESGGHTNKEQNKKGAEMFIYVLKGEVVITIENKPYPLHAGNTLYFDASLEHHFSNKSKGLVEILTVKTPVNL